jgi:hypothetical protein
VVVINPTQEMVAMNVISQPAGVIVKFNSITKNHKYRGLDKKDHFILMIMEVHGTFECDMDHFIRKYVYISMIDNWEIIYLLFFAFSFLGSMLALLFNMF